MSAARWRRTGAWWPLLPLALVPLLLPVGRLSELGTLLALVAGLWLAWRHRAELAGMPSVRLLVGLFACYTGAALISLPDAVEPVESWRVFASAWRYLPLGIYACWVLRQPGRVRPLSTLMAVLVALWAIDAWVQTLTGWSLGGHAAVRHISGVFGADNLKLGPVLAVLSPFVLWEARQRWGWAGMVAAFVLLLGPIIMAGSRQAWLQFALVGLACAWHLGGTPWRRTAWLGGAALLACLALAIAWQQSPRFAQRIERTARILDGSEKGLNWALSGRLWIWRTAANMLQAQPINGVGVRGFRYAYPAYADPDDPFLDWGQCAPGQGACHPHQWLLEVGAGTGIVGLVLWFVGIGAALRAWWRAAPAARRRAWPLSLALAVNLFPLNTHLAFYSSWWGLLTWWLLVVWCGALLAPGEAAEVRHEPA